MSHVNPQWPEEGWDQNDAYILPCGCASDQQDHTCGGGQGGEKDA